MNIVIVLYSNNGLHTQYFQQCVMNKQTHMLTTVSWLSTVDNCTEAQIFIRCYIDHVDYNTYYRKWWIKQRYAFFQIWSSDLIGGRRGTDFFFFLYRRQKWKTQHQVKQVDDTKIYAKEEGEEAAKRRKVEKESKDRGGCIWNRQKQQKARKKGKKLSIESVVHSKLSVDQ